MSLQYDYYNIRNPWIYVFTHEGFDVRFIIIYYNILYFLLMTGVCSTTSVFIYYLTTLYLYEGARILSIDTQHNITTDDMTWVRLHVIVR